jgi:hypothetical protein
VGKWVIATTMLTQIAILAGSESRIPYNEKLASVSARLRYSHYLNDAAQTLKPLIRSTDAIVIDSYNREHFISSLTLGCL